MEGRSTEVMNLSKYLEAKIAPRTFIVWPGRYAPFHLGHKAAWDELVRVFEGGNIGKIYIITREFPPREDPNNPFTFAEKKQFMIDTGVPTDRIAKIRTSPFNAPGIADALKTLGETPKPTDKLIVALSSEEAAERNMWGKYYQRYKLGDEMEPLSDKGYVYEIESKKKSATNVRKAIMDGKLESVRNMIAPKVYTRLKKIFGGKK